MKNFQIDPKTLTIIAACVAVATLLANGSVQAPVGIPTTWAAAFVSWDDFFLKIWSVAAPILIGYSSSQPGPFAPADPQIVKDATAKAALAAKAASGVVGALLIGFLALGAMGLFAPQTARAADLGVTYRQPLKGYVALIKPAPSAAPTSIAGVLSSIISQGTAKIIADAESADSVAGAPNPNSTATPQAVLNPLAHACLAGIPGASPAIPGLISFLQSLPVPANIPAPTGSGGVLTTIVVAQVNIDETQAYVNKLAATGFPASLKLACSAWALSIINAPATLIGNLNSDFINLVTLFGKSGS